MNREPAMDAAWSRAEFETRLRDKDRHSHIPHPFNLRMNSGRCSRDEIRGWFANRCQHHVIITDRWHTYVWMWE